MDKKIVGIHASLLGMFVHSLWHVKKGHEKRLMTGFNGQLDFFSLFSDKPREAVVAMIHPD